ncbi:MAG TPA: helix-turn-helix transcriptional regulator [Thermoanaerobaculia bacterium]
MDLVLKLRELRRLRGLTQGDVARLSGIGVKTISSFETGERIGSLKLAQLERLLAVYGLTPKEFFGRSVEKDLAPWDLDEEEVAEKRLLEDLNALPKELQRKLFDRFQLMVETVAAVYGQENRQSP